MSGWATFWENHAVKAKDAAEADGYCIEGQLLPPGIIQQMAADVLLKLDLSGNDVLLEVGCGAGLILSFLKDRLSQGAGCDFSLSMIQKAKRAFPGMSFCVSEASLLPYPEAYFDRVLCYGVFIYFKSEEYAKTAIRELVRVTKPGGKILIGEISDPGKLEDYHKEKERLGFSRTENRENKGSNGNDGLKYLNLSPEFFKEFLPSLGHNLKYHVLPQNIPGKITSVLRYDVLIELHGD